MFKITNDRTYTWTVNVPMPAEGKIVEQPLDVTFHVLDESEISKLMTEQLRPSLPLVERALVKAVVGDETGKELPWNDDVKSRLLALPYVVSALATAYLSSVYGGRQKN